MKLKKIYVHFKFFQKLKNVESYEKNSIFNFNF